MEGLFEHWWYAPVATIASVALLFILTKIMGKRQISQLSFFDYVTGITIGSIAAELSTMQNENFIRPLIALILFSLASVFISWLADKSIVLRKFFVGKPLVIYDNEQVYIGNLRKARLDINEFLTAIRYEGYFDLADVQTCVMETNGQISVIPKSTARPVIPEDLKLAPKQDKMVANVVIDGKMMPDILKQTGNDEQWLRTQLSQQGVKLQNCMLGTVDDENVFSAYEAAQEDSEKKNLFI